jgi:hypothetical protein
MSIDYTRLNETELYCNKMKWKVVELYQTVEIFFVSIMV